MQEKKKELEKVWKKLKEISNADYSDFVKVTEDGCQVLPLQQISSSKRQAIASIRDGPKGVEIKLYDKLKALEMMGKILGCGEETDAEALDGVEAFLKKQGDDYQY